MRVLSVEESENIFNKLLGIANDSPRLKEPLRCAASVFQNPMGTIIPDEDMSVFDKQIEWCLKGEHAVFLSPDASTRLRNVFNEAHRLRGDGISITSYEMSLISADVIMKDGHFLRTLKADVSMTTDEDVNFSINNLDAASTENQESDTYDEIFELFMNKRSASDNYTKLIQALTMADPNLAKEVNDRLKSSKSSSVVVAAGIMGGD